jgi:hypothetical protein
MEAIRATDNNDAAATRETLQMFGGMALMMLGAGLVLTSPVVRRYLGGLNVGNLLQTAAPDFERYLKLKAM